MRKSMRNRETKSAPAQPNKLRLRVLYILVALGAVILLLLPFCAKAASYGPYDMDAVAAIDGDTIRGNTHVFPGFISTFSVRLAGIDTPELHSAGGRVVPECEKVLARNAMRFVNDWLLANEPIRISQVKADKYKLRVDALVTGKTGQVTLNAALLVAGHARASAANQPRQPWCQ